MLDSIFPRTVPLRQAPAKTTHINEESKKPFILPDEILVQVTNYLLDEDESFRFSRPLLSPPKTQLMFATLCRTNKQWYRISVPNLYANPWLYGHNYQLFVRTVCPTSNESARRSDLARFVKQLDLRLLVHQGSISTTAQLIGRTKANLEVFRAPSSTFGVNCLVALSKCSKLQILDLSRLHAQVQFDDFVRTLSQLHKLQALDTPRIPRTIASSSPQAANKEITWPPFLSKLRMSKLDGSGFLWLFFSAPRWINAYIPNTITSLIIQDGNVEKFEMIQTLQHDVPSLKELTLTNLNLIRGFNNVLQHAPNLERLCISINLITAQFPVFSVEYDGNHPLKHLEIASCSGTVELRSNPATFFSNSHLSEAVNADQLPKLRRVDVWESAAARFRTDELDYGLLHAELVQLGIEDGFDGAGMRIIRDPGWDGMITLT